MSMNLLVGTVAGAVIGGITNSIAIKMLFRPLNPIKIGKYTLPFTPGVIPKERERIANKIGEVISQELLNEEVLRDWLLKEDVYLGIEKAIDRYLEEQAKNDQTVQEVLYDYVGKERSMYLICELEEGITYKLYSKVVGMELGKIVVEKIQIAFSEGAFGNLLGPMNFLINDSLVESLANKIEPTISKFIVDEGEEIIRKAVEEEREKLLERRVKEVVKEIISYDDFIKHSVIKGYKQFIQNHITHLLKVLNIQKIVEERILALDMLEMERIILSIMKKELNAVIGFGVLLGAIMGILAGLL